MASGCIVGTCKYCDDHIWEDEDYDVNMKSGMFHIECENKYPKINKLAELGRLSLTTQICYWGYEYADGDCQEGKCERNELCRVRDGMLKGKVCK